MASPFIRKMERLGPLSDEERRALLSATQATRIVEADQDIAREGDRPGQCCLLLEGFACRYKLLPDGKRPILSIQIAGDFCDLHSLYLDRLDHSIGTLTRCRVAFVPHGTIAGWIASYPRIARALWHDTLVDGAIFREWVANVGAREAYERFAHLLCELALRMRWVGLAKGNECELPLTQSELGDALGISLVHVNRVLQELRRDGLVELKRGVLVIEDWGRLAEAGQFDPAYLFGGAEPAGVDLPARPAQR